MHTSYLSPDASGLASAADVLRTGNLVAFPTETVYGLGGDARSNTAVARIFEAKGRPRFNPLIVHVAGLAEAAQIAHLSAQALNLAQRFWPGPLTLVLPLRADAGLSPLVTADLTSVALRIPAHPVARALIAAFGGPIAAPSANPSGRISPTTAAHVMDGLGGKIAAIVNGGACAVGVESTILSLLEAGPRLLRQGGLEQEQIEAALGFALAVSHETGERPIAPGQLASHYAPRAGLRMNAGGALTGEVMIGFGLVSGELTLSASGDLIEAAANLFASLRAADALCAARGASMAIAPIPNHGLGRAINDRLTRAAAPRR